ncbi:MAG TPA: hypothetical protein VG456_05365, partial [Candidatus Sulfopaludibacter sp.]|nr:hypothetical protein [Candidatus Sulfopaludibacter sp.]
MPRTLALLLALTAPLLAIDADRDFTGHWLLDARASNTRALDIQPVRDLTVTQQDVVILCSTPSDGPKPTEWFYSLTGADARYKIGDESHNSVAKWEGAALLINTLVTGSQHYTLMDRWRLSRDHATLTIIRQVVRRTGQVEATLVYRKEAAPAPPPPVTTTTVEVEEPVKTEPPKLEPLRRERPPEPPRPEPELVADLVIPAGTRIPLSLRNTVDTKHSHEGDHIYLLVAMPVAARDHIVIPQGSFVNGTLTVSKPAGKVKGKGELFIRFDTLVLPNGVTRDFHSRLGSADANARGDVDSEGKVTGQRDSHGDGRTVATGAGVGTAVGGIAG